MATDVIFGLDFFRGLSFSLLVIGNDLSLFCLRIYLHLSHSGYVGLQSLIMGDHAIIQDVPAPLLPCFADFEGIPPLSQEFSNASSWDHFDTDQDLVSLLERMYMDSIFVIVPLLTNLGLLDVNPGDLLDLR